MSCICIALSGIEMALIWIFLTETQKKKCEVMIIIPHFANEETEATLLVSSSANIQIYVFQLQVQS